ncbi:MAG TPA: NAD(P)H-binding protein [Chryseosolibacter sp.]|nr:NAD(P)H-binding protein [Chryseosolibacter sp.]
MAQILVTGGTGTLGRQIVQQFTYQGLDVGILTTRQHVDLASGAKVYRGDLIERESIRDAAEKASIIIHCASDRRNLAVDVEGTRNLLQSVAKSTLRHFIYVSVAGADRSSYPYYQAKNEGEKIVQGFDLPWSVLRVTQFHDLVWTRLIKPFDHNDGSPLRIPGGLKLQSIDVKDVAVRLQGLAMTHALRSTITIGGPEILTLEAMTRAYLDAQRRDDGVAPDDISGEFYDLFRSGININPEWRMGKITWEDFLSENLKK